MKTSLNSISGMALFAALVLLLLAGLQFTKESRAQNAPVVSGDQTASTTPLLDKFRHLNTSDARTQERLLREISKDWHYSKEELIGQFESDDNQVQCAAAFLLGLFRYEETVSMLAEEITLQDKFYPRVQKRRWYWDRYPAAEALARIGNPSIPAMMNNLEISNDAKVRELSLDVINYVDGQEIAQFRLERAVAKQTDAKKKANLKRALAEFRKSWPDKQ